MNHSHRKVRMLTEGALCIALAEILSFLPLYKMPWGGSVDLAMLPIILFCVRWGFGPGLVVSFAHAVFQTLFEGGIAIGWPGGSVPGQVRPRNRRCLRGSVPGALRCGCDHLG